VLENDTDATVDGIPPHSIECLVYGGSETAAEIRAAIFEAKPAGILAHGDSSGTHVDEQGNEHTIKYTVPDTVPIYMDITLQVIPSTYVGDTAVRDAIAAYYDENNRVGLDVKRSRIESICMALAGVVDVSVQLSIVSLVSGMSSNNVTIADREVAVITGNATYIAIDSTDEVPGSP
jgi:uncharacterized phage protein gp47/JayE